MCLSGLYFLCVKRVYSGAWKNCRIIFQLERWPVCLPATYSSVPIATADRNRIITKGEGVLGIARLVLIRLFLSESEKR